MSSLSDSAFTFKSFCDVDFSGGDLSSNCGMLFMGEFINKIGLLEYVKENFRTDRRTYREHSDDSILLQLIYQNIAGYFTDDNADHLFHEPIFTTLLGKKRLASQPTISRFWKRCDDLSGVELNLALKHLRKQAYKIQMPSDVVFDIDTTILNTFGKQEGSEYIHHYQAVGYHPILCYDGNNGDLLKAELREGNMYCGNGAARFIKPLLEEYREIYPQTSILVRGDSGFAMPDLYSCVEEFPKATYLIRLKENSVLHKKVQKTADDFMKKTDAKVVTFDPVYGEFLYAAESWEKERRVVFKIELHKSEGALELFPSFTFLVTNRNDSPEEIVKLYCKRGNMENFIKESKNDFNFKHMCSHDMVTNENRLAVSAIAYSIFNIFRRICLPEIWKKFRADEIRMRLIHIAGRHILHAKKKFFRLCSTYLYKEQFAYILERVNELEVLLAT